MIVTENRVLKWTLVGLLVLLLIPLLVALGMMMFSAGMMAQMNGMMSAGLMGVCVLWTVLVSAALILLIVLLTRDSGARAPDRIHSGEVHSPLPH